jgi:hypothetical protein
LCLTISVCSAKQVAFNKEEQGDNYQFNYQWLNHQGNTEELSFMLNKPTLFNQFRQFKQYKADIAKRYVFKHVIRSMQQTPIANTSVNIKRVNGELALNINAQDNDNLNKAQQKVALLQKQAQEKYLKQEYYNRFITYEGEQAIKPDHARIALESIPNFKHLKPLILEHVNIKNIRYATNYILSFSQSIPYSTLASRATSSGAGFNVPGKLLWENQGDCDSKVTLTASLLRNLMPRVKMVLVYIEGHALIGIEIKPEGDDMFITIDNIHYVLGEPTGPALMPLGKISMDSEQAILNGLYSTEAFFAE